MKSIYELNINEFLGTEDYFIRRVPGGWIYTEKGDNISSCFVPYNDEFKLKESESYQETLRKMHSSCMWGFDTFNILKKGDNVESCYSIPCFGEGLDLDLITGEFDQDKLWYAKEHPVPVVRNMGGSDQFLEIHNGSPANYETSPGSIKDWVGDMEMLFYMRRWNGKLREYFISGQFASKWGSNGYLELWNLPGESGVVNSKVKLGMDEQIGKDHEFRYLVSEGGYLLEVFFNGSIILTHRLKEKFELKEFGVGSRSHPLGFHFRGAYFTKGEFTPKQLYNISHGAETLWPRGVLPKFPFLTQGHLLKGYSFNKKEKTWYLPEQLNLDAGQNLNIRFDWLIHQGDKFEGKETMLDNALLLCDCDEVYDITRPSLNSPYLQRNDSRLLLSNAGNGTNYISCVRTPFDEKGRVGLAQTTEIVKDNIL